MADFYKAGDPPPGGYLNWHAWAEVQSKAGLEQVQCDRCRLWRFPQELAVISGTGNTCLQCADGVPAGTTKVCDCERAMVPVGSTCSRCGGAGWVKAPSGVKEVPRG